MKDQKIEVYTIFSIILLAGVLLWIVLRLSIVINSNTVKMETIFHSIRTTILEDVFSSRKTTSRTSNFVKLSNLALSRPSLKSLVITDTNNQPVYIFARNPHAIVKQGHSAPLQTIQRITDRELSSFQSFNGKVYQIKTVFTILEDSFLFQTIKRALAILLVFLIISVLILVSQKNTTTLKGKKENNGVSPSSQEDTKKESNKEDRATKGESFPFQKLSSELKRAASFDQDLVLVLIKADNEFLRNNGSSFFDILHEFFSYSDLAFKYSESRYALILPNEDIDTGIARIREFDQHIAEEFDVLSLYPFRYGLSSRNGRLIDGDVLYKEASTALVKAINDKDSHIIGFRPDPGKYREFLSKESF